MRFVEFVKNSRERNTVSSLLILLGFSLVSLFVAGVVQLIMVVAKLIADSGIQNISEAVTIDKMGVLSDMGWWNLVIMQGLSSVIMFILTSWLFWNILERKKWSDYNSTKTPVLSVFFMIFLIQITFLPLNSYLGSINENMQFPEFLKDLEIWFKTMEESAAELTEFLAMTDTLPQLLANILVIGVIAGIGEELFFRGLVQRKLIRSFKNYHLAVWVAAILFSSIHFQFYGFIPRLLLGALFGYLYVWTGNILVPIAAHIFNNSLAVILYHLVAKGIISPEVEKMDTIPFEWVAVSSIVCLLLLFTFYQNQVNKRTDYLT